MKLVSMMADQWDEILVALMAVLMVAKTVVQLDEPLVALLDE